MIFQHQDPSSGVCTGQMNREVTLIRPRYTHSYHCFVGEGEEDRKGLQNSNDLYGGENDDRKSTRTFSSST